MAINYRLSVIYPILASGLLCVFSVPTQAQQQLSQDEILQLLRQRMGAAAPTNPAPPVQAQPAISPEELARKVAAFPQVAGGAKFVGRKDGFEVNGSRYVDPQGRIVQFGYDHASANVSYLVEAGSGQYVIKFTRALSNADPLAIATASRQGGLWSVQTADGKSLSGQRLLLTSCGFVVAREGAAFRYTPGEGLRTFAGVDGFHVAAFQNGDIATTGYLLLERDKDRAPAGGLIGGLKSLGSGLGLNKKEDYALVNLASGKTYPINISIEDKETGVYSDCYKRSRSSLVNQCERADFVESLYAQDGRRNLSHYFWRIAWFSTKSGPLLVAQENGLHDITLTNLATGKKMTALDRTLGIAGFDVEQEADGIIHLTAQMGFSQQSIPDVEKTLNEAATPAVPVDVTQK